MISLNLYNLRQLDMATAINVLSGMVNLKKLDISCDRDSGQYTQEGSGTQHSIRLLLEEYESLPNLRSFDISGREGIDISDLR